MIKTLYNRKIVFFKLGPTFHFIHLYIYPPDSQESDRDAIYTASNNTTLLPEIPKYCCSFEIFIFVFCFTEI